MKNMFAIKGNICGRRIQLGRILQKPPLSQSELAVKIQLLGLNMTPIMISRIEKNERHVCDAELKIIAQALNLPINWLLEATEF